MKFIFATCHYSQLYLCPILFFDEIDSNLLTQSQAYEPDWTFFDKQKDKFLANIKHNLTSNLIS